MLQRNRLLALGIVCAGCLLACSHGDRVSDGGGGAMEIPNALALRLLDTAGVPMARTRVELMDMRKWRAAAQAGDTIAKLVLTTDDNGYLHTELSYPDEQMVQVLQPGQAGLSRASAFVVTSDSARIATFSLKPVSTIHADSSSQAPGSTVRIYGSSIATTLDERGGFRLAGVPAGQVSLTLTDKKAWAPWDRISVVGGADRTLDSLPAWTPGQVVVDNFDDGNAWSEQGLWYSYNDLGFGGTSTISPSSETPEIFAQGIVDMSCHQGKCLSVHYHLDPTGWNFPYAAIGTSLEPAMDLRTLDSVEFWCRGAGEVRLNLSRPNVLWAVKHLQARFSPSASWSRVVLKPGDFHGTSGANQDSFPADAPSWSAFAKSIDGMSFNFLDTAGSWLMLDDIRLHGEPAAMLR